MIGGVVNKNGGGENYSPRGGIVVPLVEDINMVVQYLMMNYGKDQFNVTTELGLEFENNRLVSYLLSLLEVFSATEIFLAIYNTYVGLSKDKIQNGDEFIEILIQYCFRWYFLEDSTLREAMELFIRKKIQNNQRLLKIWETKCNEKLPYKKPSESSHLLDNYIFLEWTPMTLASQLTLQAAYRMWQLHPREFFHQSWQKKNREQMAPEICKMTDLWNHISGWVSTSIVQAYPRLKIPKLLTYFVTLATSLEELRNYHCLTAVVSGLGNVAVSRLKEFWQQLPKQLVDTYTRLVSYRDPAQSFKFYREKLKMAKSTAFSAPYIPFPVVYLSDITFINLGNPEYLNGKLNYRRLRYLGYSIAQVLGFQFSPPYEINPINDVQIYISCMHKNILDDKQLFELSKKIPLSVEKNVPKMIQLISSRKLDKKPRFRRYSSEILAGEDALEAEKLNISYITDRILVMGYPIKTKRIGGANKTENVMKAFLHRVHGPRKYIVFNLCNEKELKYPENEFLHYADYPFAENGLPPFHLILKFCQQAKAWFDEEDDKVIVIHCKDGKGRSGIMVSCFLLYSGRCTTAVHALKKFDWLRAPDGKGVTLPSQRSLVYYWEKILCLNKKFNFLNQPMNMKSSNYKVGDMGAKEDIGSVLRDVFIRNSRTTLPLFVLEFVKMKNHSFGNLVPQLKIIDSMAPEDKLIFSGEIDKNTAIYKIPDLQFYGLLTLQFFQKETGVVLFSFSFHPSFLSKDASSPNTYTIPKSSLDGPHLDMRHKRYPENFTITLVSNAQYEVFSVPESTLTVEVSTSESSQEEEKDTKSVLKDSKENPVKKDDAEKSFLEDSFENQVTSPREVDNSVIMEEDSPNIISPRGSRSKEQPKEQEETAKLTTLQEEDNTTQNQNEIEKTEEKEEMKDSQKTEQIEKQCMACKKSIHSNPRVLNETMFWHDTCFICAVCSLPIQDDSAAYLTELVCALCIAAADDDDDDEEDLIKSPRTNEPKKQAPLIPAIQRITEVAQETTNRNRKVSSAKLVKRALLSQRSHKPAKVEAKKEPTSLQDLITYLRNEPNIDNSRSKTLPVPETLQTVTPQTEDRKMNPKSKLVISQLLSVANAQATRPTSPPKYTPPTKSYSASPLNKSPSLPVTPKADPLTTKPKANLVSITSDPILPSFPNDAVDKLWQSNPRSSRSQSSLSPINWHMGETPDRKTPKKALLRNFTETEQKTQRTPISSFIPLASLQPRQNDLLASSPGRKLGFARTMTGLTKANVVEKLPTPTPPPTPTSSNPTQPPPTKSTPTPSSTLAPAPASNPTPSATSASIATFQPQLTTNTKTHALPRIRDDQTPRNNSDKKKTDANINQLLVELGVDKEGDDNLLEKFLDQNKT